MNVFKNLCHQFFSIFLIRIYPVKKIGNVPEFLLWPAVNFFKFFVHIGGGAFIDIIDSQPYGEIVQYRLDKTIPFFKIFLILFFRRFRVFAFCYIHMGAEHPDGSSLFIGLHGFAPGQNPPPSIVFGAHPEFYFKRFRYFKMLVYGCFRVR